MRNYDEKLIVIWKNRYKILIFIFSFIIIGIILFYFTTKQSNKDLEDFRQRYKLVQIKDSFEGKINAISCFKGTSVISMSNEEELVLSTSRNYEYKIFEMCCFIQVGDSIFKESKNDSIFVMRGSDRYYFVHGKFIGEKYDSRFYRDPCR